MPPKPHQAPAARVAGLQSHSAASGGQLLANRRELRAAPSRAGARVDPAFSYGNRVLWESWQNGKQGPMPS